VTPWQQRLFMERGFMAAWLRWRQLPLCVLMSVVSNLRFTVWSPRSVNRNAADCLTPVGLTRVTTGGLLRSRVARPKCLILVEQQYFVWDTASQNTKWTDMLKVWGGMPPWASIWLRLCFCVGACPTFSRLPTRYTTTATAAARAGDPTRTSTTCWPSSSARLVREPLKNNHSSPPSITRCPLKRHTSGNSPQKSS